MLLLLPDSVMMSAVAGRRIDYALPERSRAEYFSEIENDPRDCRYRYCYDDSDQSQ